MRLLTKHEYEKLLATQTILATLEMRRTFGGVDSQFLDVSDANPFWSQNFSYSQLTQAIYKAPAEKSELELELLAEKAKEHLVADFDAYTKRDENFQAKATDSTIKTAGGAEVDVKDLLAFYRQWGKETAGLIELYAVGDEDVIHLHFESRAGLSSCRTEVDNTENGVMEIYRHILMRQDEIAEATRLNATLPDLILQVAKAYQAGLPQNYQTPFSYLADDFTDCFVLTTDGSQRVPDQIYDSYGNLQSQIYCDAQPIPTNGIKVWRQIMQDELVVKVHRLRISSDNNETEDLCYQYTFELVVQPLQNTKAQTVVLKGIATDFCKQIIMAGTGLPFEQYCGWVANCTSTFAVDHHGKIVPESLFYYVPKYYYNEANLLVNLDDESIAASVSKDPINLMAQYDTNGDPSQQENQTETSWPASTMSTEENETDTEEARVDEESSNETNTTSAIENEF